ncbi:MAG: DUF1501 domain-containing protein, partial [Planctomycetota bacterium]
MIPLPSEIARRTFLKRSGISLGGMALGSLLQQSAARANSKLVGDDRWQGVLQPLHFAPRAKRVIWLYMAGGMSHLETFDFKPKLAELHGKPMPESFTKVQQIAQLQGAKLNCFGPQHPFQKHGQSGLEFSSVFPMLGQ